MLVKETPITNVLDILGVVELSGILEMNCNKHLAIISALEFCCCFVGIEFSIEPIAPLHSHIHASHNSRPYPCMNRYLQSVFMRSSIECIRISASAHTSPNKANSTNNNEFG